MWVGFRYAGVSSHYALGLVISTLKNRSMLFDSFSYVNVQPTKKCWRSNIVDLHFELIIGNTKASSVCIIASEIIADTDDLIDFFHLFVNFVIGLKICC